MSKSQWYPPPPSPLSPSDWPTTRLRKELPALKFLPSWGRNFLQKAHFFTLNPSSISDLWAFRCITWKNMFGLVTTPPPQPPRTTTTPTRPTPATPPIHYQYQSNIKKQYSLRKYLNSVHCYQWWRLWELVLLVNLISQIKSETVFQQNYLKSDLK